MYQKLLNSLEKEELIKPFLEFARNENSSESILIWLKIQEFKQLSENNELEINARTIYESFLKPKSDYEVNIPNEKKEMIFKRINDNEITKGMFSEVEILILDNLVDPFLRFKKSKFFPKEKKMIKPFSLERRKNSDGKLFSGESLKKEWEFKKSNSEKVMESNGLNKNWKFPVSPKKN
jgi:hypothetical protein